MIVSQRPSTMRKRWIGAFGAAAALLAVGAHPAPAAMAPCRKGGSGQVKCPPTPAGSPAAVKTARTTGNRACKKDPMRFVACPPPAPKARCGDPKRHFPHCGNPGGTAQ